ncbi:MAG: lipopolysaccharide transport periplasmic protein LptA [Betaproteobacteria bacterium]|nr:lipopolysaccharide transport periplasmic protein LptA [Betaproteobacteria bacterium]
MNRLNPSIVTLQHVLRGLLLLAGIACLPAWAEKADSSKPINLDARSADVDEANKTKVFEGSVVMTQGTLQITAERVVVKEDKEGYISAEAFGGAGKMVTFRQKREGFDDYIEAQADRVEFDDRADTIKLFSRAQLKSTGNEIKSEYIFYNSLTEVYGARGNVPIASGGAVTGDGKRVQIVIQPSAKTGAGKAATPAAPKS